MTRDAQKHQNLYFISTSVDRDDTPVALLDSFQLFNAAPTEHIKLCNPAYEIIYRYSPPPCNKLQERSINLHNVLCNKEMYGGGGALIETIFYCGSAASGWKRGKRVLDHMGNYNGTRLKTAMSNSIPALVPTGHSSLTEPSPRRELAFYAPLSSSKCSQKVQALQTVVCLQQG